jgi:LPXTG-motif cell wall-anchored protein
MTPPEPSTHLSQPSPLRRRAFGRWRRPAIIAVLVAGILGVFVAPAFAHHPIVTGDVSCSTDGATVAVAWHLQNSESVLPAGTGRIMTVNSAVVDQGTLVGIQPGTTVLPQPLPGSTVNGSTTLASAATGSITLTLHVRWDSPGPQDVTGTATVALPGSCPHPTTTTSAAPATTTTQPPRTTTTQPPRTTTTQHTTTTTAARTTTTSAPAIAGITTTTSRSSAVLGATIVKPAATPPATLPRTGSSFGSTALLMAGVATLLGALGLRLSRRTSRSHH